MGVWRSGSASALHAEGLGFDPLVVHTFCFCPLSIGELFCARSLLFLSTDNFLLLKKVTFGLVQFCFSVTILAVMTIWTFREAGRFLVQTTRTSDIYNWHVSCLKARSKTSGVVFVGRRQFICPRSSI
jgi:hypothetical protein